MKTRRNNIKLLQVVYLVIICSLTIAVIYNIYYANGLEKQIRVRDELIEEFAQKDSILNNIIDIKYDTLDTKIKMTYSLVRSSDNVLKYDDLATYMDKYYLIKDSMDVLREVINLIEEHYPIRHFIRVRDSIRTISVDAHLIDASLMLYNFYQDRVKYDPIKNEWIIWERVNDTLITNRVSEYKNGNIIYRKKRIIK